MPLARAQGRGDNPLEGVSRGFSEVPNTDARKLSLESPQRQELDVLGTRPHQPMGWTRSWAQLVPDEETREALCVGILLCIWPWLEKDVCNSDHLKVVLCHWDPAEEAGKGAAAAAGAMPTPPNQLSSLRRDTRL